MAKRQETPEEFCQRTLTHIWEGEMVCRWVVQEKPVGTARWTTAETITREQLGKKPEAKTLVKAIERAIINSDIGRARVQAWLPNQTRNQYAQKVWPPVGEAGAQDSPATMDQAMVEWNQFALRYVKEVYDTSLDALRQAYDDRLASQKLELDMYRAQEHARRMELEALRDRTSERELSKEKVSGGLEIGKAIVNAMTAKWLGAEAPEAPLSNALQGLANTLTPAQIAKFGEFLDEGQMAVLMTLLIDEERQKNQRLELARPNQVQLKAAKEALSEEEYAAYTRAMDKTLRALQAGPS